MDPALAAEDVAVTRGGRAVLNGVSLAVTPDTELLIEGMSGAGKTTLFYVLGLLQSPTDGTVLVGGVDAGGLSERKRARLRRDHVGFVFQDFQLVPDLTAWENARLPQEHGGDTDEDWLDELFATLGIERLRSRYPPSLSGGEKQRVAIARALANRPAVVLADEPTGQLDEETALGVVELLRSLRADVGTALVVVSHDRTIVEAFPNRLTLADGRLDWDDATLNAPDLAPSRPGEAASRPGDASQGRSD